MNNVIVVFPKKENATQIRNILVHNGIEVFEVCTSGAQVIQCSESLSDGIIISGYRMCDIMYSELKECLPSSFEMILISSKQRGEAEDIEGVTSLATPIKPHELINTMWMIHNKTDSSRRAQGKKRTRTKEQSAILDKAKALLIKRKRITEDEAHKYLQKVSMSNGCSLVDAAYMTLSILKR